MDTTYRPADNCSPGYAPCFIEGFGFYGMVPADQLDVEIEAMSRQPVGATAADE